MKKLVISSMFMFLVVGVIGCGKSQEVTNPIFENQVSANSIPENQVSENKIQYHADAVLFAGDMIDYLSTENIKCFKIGLDQIKTPSMYVRSDHDVGIGYTPNISKSYANQLLQEVGKNESIYLMEYEQLLVLGINNSASQITKQQMEEITNIYNNATKPIVVVTHVPINSMIDNGLKKASLELR